MMHGTSSAASLPKGTSLGRYLIGDPISSGAMGAVYRALDRVADRPVAVKQLLDTRHQARFQIEARLLSQLKHPRVVSVLDHFQDPTGVYLVMNLVEGVDLGATLERDGDPGIPVADALIYARQACEALQYVHDQQIIHRDVKPQNLILDDRGVMLVDFGVARAIDSTDTGTVGIGTPRYMAPEVFAGGAVSPRSDVFSLAATLWALITGSPPVYADDTKLSEQFPGVSPDLERTIRAGLEMIPERRVASANAFAQAIGAPLPKPSGASLVLSLPRPPGARALIEAVVRTAAGVFDASAASIALTDHLSGDLVYQAAWGAGAREIVGVRLEHGKGISGSVVRDGEAIAVPDCRNDPRFSAQIAAGTGYVPYTMLVAPLKRGDVAIGALSLLDRRDGEPYGPQDVVRAALFAELALTALDVDPESFSTLGAPPG